MVNDGQSPFNRNLGYWMEERNRRLTDSLQPSNGSMLSGGTLIGSPTPDPAWDAFWGAMRHQQDDAEANGMHYRLDARGLNNTSPAIDALRRAAKGT